MAFVECLRMYIVEEETTVEYLWGIPILQILDMP